MSSSEQINRAIIRTLAYFDVFDYPLTTAEIWRWLYPEPGFDQEISRENFAAALENLQARGQIKQSSDHYFLPGREGIVQNRQTRFEENKFKWRRAKTTARWLSIVPFVRLVAVVNTLAINNAKPTSDIDFLIVAEAGRLWLCRMLVTAMVTMLGYRRHGTKIANRVCLSFYVTTDGLDLESLRNGPADHHFTFWASQAVPLVDVDGSYLKYQQANGWILKSLPHAWDWDWMGQMIMPPQKQSAIRQMYEMIFNTPVGDWLENWQRGSQRRKMASNKNSRQDLPNTDVVISDRILKFHEADRRAEYNQRFEADLRRQIR